MSDSVVRQSSPARAHVRRAEDFLVAVNPGSEKLHRAAHAQMVDYRLQEITDGLARGVGTVPGFCEDKPGYRSPWHYHECDLQLAIVLRGSAQFAARPDFIPQVVKGDIAFVPGHVVHDVSEPSSDYQVIELTFPGTFTTVEVGIPESGSPTAMQILSPSAASRLDDAASLNGFVIYRYSVPVPFDDRYQIDRERRSRLLPFKAAPLSHQDRFHFMLVLEGERVVEFDGVASRLIAGDILVVPAGVTCRSLEATEEHEALWIRVR
jgi:quercetin dioxygenase-like cupin family protein